MINLAKADTHPAWCPGCGNYAILKVFNAVIAEAGIDPDRLVLVSGIGQAAKFPHYPVVPANVFNGLHGRALPAATGIKLANHKLKVVVTSGDGDMYGEGGNHFLHAIRRNIGITAFVHDNQEAVLVFNQLHPRLPSCTVPLPGAVSVPALDVGYSIPLVGCGRSPDWSSRANVVAHNPIQFSGNQPCQRRGTRPVLVLSRTLSLRNSGSKFNNLFFYAVPKA